jgi:hypothetical protein
METLEEEALAFARTAVEVAAELSPGAFANLFCRDRATADRIQALLRGRYSMADNLENIYVTVMH